MNKKALKKMVLFIMLALPVIAGLYAYPIETIVLLGLGLWFRIVTWAHDD